MTAAVALDPTPFVLLPYQQAWVGDPAPIRIIEKSRRIGISWATAAEVVLEASETDGCDVWYVGYNKDMAQEFIRDCAWWARKLDAAVGEVEQSLFTESGSDKEILIFTIRFASGYRITALSSRPSNLRNKRGHIILDEAAHHPDLKGLLQSALAVVIWGGRSRVDIISTHYGVNNYFNTLVNEVRAGKRNYSLHRVTIDEALEQGLFKRICLVNDKEWTQEIQDDWIKELLESYGESAQEELYCVPSESGGSYLSRMLVERQMVPGDVVRLEVEEGFVVWPEKSRVGHVDAWLKENVAPLLAALPEKQMHFMGEDFGRVSDRTVLAIGNLDQELKRTHPFAIELSNVPFEQQKQIVFYVLERLPRFIGAAFDATGNGSYLAEVSMQKFGENLIQCISLNDPWYRDNLPPFKASLEDGQCELVRDADHLLDLAALKVIDGTPKLPKAKTATTGDGPMRHGDAAIAYALSYFASCLPPAEYDYTAAPKHVRNRDRDVKTGQGFKATRGGLL